MAGRGPVHRLTFTAAFWSNRQMQALEVSAVADNLLLALRFFGHARKSAEIRDLPGVSLFFCGLNYAAFNTALLALPVVGDGAGLSCPSRVSTAHFSGRKLR